MSVKEAMLCYHVTLPFARKDDIDLYMERWNKAPKPESSARQ